MKRTVAVVVILSAGIFSSARAQEKSAARPPDSAQTALTVTAAALGTGVEERKLVGESSQFSLNDRVYLWLALAGGPAPEIDVTWKQGTNVYETKLSVGGKTWHTWAYKTAAAPGPWEVTVSEPGGIVLKKLEFTVGAK